MRQAFKYIFIGLLSTSLATAQALPSDRFKKVDIKADKSIYNYKTGVNVFEGHVKVDQGSSHLIADKLVTKNNKQHKIIEAIAYGFNRKAHYWTLPKENDAIMHARAKIIKYYPVTGNITLYEKGLITQGENSFHGELIHYNSIDQVINVPGKSNNRSVLVYNP